MENEERPIPDVFGPFLTNPRAAVCPIFGTNEDGGELLGSGVLVNVAGSVFLLTAAHVLDHKENYDLMIPRKDRIGSLYGHIARTNVEDPSQRSADKNDIGFIRFDSKLANDLDPDLRCLEYDEIDFEDTTSPGDAYTSIGFPIIKSRVGRGTFATEQFSISGEGTGGEIYLKLGASIQRHLAIRFRNKKAVHFKTMRRSMAPAPHGMSGGGIFAWSKRLPDPTALAVPKLVGVLTEYHRSEHMFLGTRVNRHFSGIASQHSDLPFARSLPVSHRGPVNR